MKPADGTSGRRRIEYNDFGFALVVKTIRAGNHCAGHARSSRSSRAIRFFALPMFRGLVRGFAVKGLILKLNNPPIG
jgi:hypothetical protein